MIEHKPCPYCGDHVKPCRCSLLKRIDELNAINKESLEALQSVQRVLQLRDVAEDSDEAMLEYIQASNGLGDIVERAIGKTMGGGDE